MNKRRIILVVFLIWLSIFGVAREKGDPIDPNGRAIYLADFGFHTALYMPVEMLSNSDNPRAQKLAARYTGADFVEFGWGDREFYMVMGGFENFELLTGIRAFFWPTPTVMQIVPYEGSVEELIVDREFVRFPLSEMAQNSIVNEVMNGFAGMAPIAPSRYGEGHFYEGVGQYMFYNTCNNWMSRVLRAGGIASSRVLASHSTPLIWELQRRYSND